MDFKEMMDGIYERLSGLEQWAINHDVEGIEYGKDFECRDE